MFLGQFFYKINYPNFLYLCQISCTIAPMKEKVVVTGGAGFIGVNLTQSLLDEGYDVHIIDDLSAGKEELVPEGAVLHVGDIRNGSLVNDVFQNASYIFHLAARPRVQDSIDNPLETNDVNVNGMLVVLQAAQHAKVKKFIFSSSSAVYGDLDTMPLQEDMQTQPMSPYGIHKLVGEHYCRMWSMLYGLETVSLRYFNAYGPHCDALGSYALVIAYFMQRVQEGKPMTVIGDGSHTRDYVHTIDISRANILAAQNPLPSHGEVYNIGTGREVSVREIASIIGGPTVPIPPRVEPPRTLADATRAHERFGWEATVSIEKGIAALKKEMLQSSEPVLQ